MTNPSTPPATVSVPGRIQSDKGWVPKKLHTPRSEWRKYSAPIWAITSSGNFGPFNGSQELAQ